MGTKYPTDEELAAAVADIMAAVRENIPKLRAAIPQLVQEFSDDEWAALKDTEDRRRQAIDNGRAEDEVVRCPHCLKVLCTRWEAGLTAVERAKRLHERQLKHFAETQRQAGERKEAG
jgi:hypothetical protein